ncbi:MAG: hypothetical protein NTV86_22495 [Planctomycetota bacterium]|nr:hypothetical protein [Planctomycetota bacterium]
MNARWLVSIAVGLLLTAGQACAADTSGGEMIKMVTQGASTDAQRAAKLVEAAARLGDDPATQEALYNKAYELGLAQVDGVESALKALEGLEAIQKIDPAQLEERRGKAYRLLYARGSAAAKAQAGAQLVDLLVAQGQTKEKAARPAEALGPYQEALSIATAIKRRDLAAQIGERIKDVNARLALEKRAKELQAALDAKPDDLHARQEYVLLCVVELDDPARAKGALNDSLEQAMQTYVPLAAQALSETAPPACLELARWYEGLALKAARNGKLNTLRRAQAYYTRALEAGTLGTVDKLKAREALEQVQARLDAAGGTAPPIDLLAMLDPAKDVVAGHWKAQGHGLSSDATPLARVMLPYQVPAEYDLHVEFTRLGGSTVCLILSHAGRQFVMETGWDAGETGFAYINGQHMNVNETSRRFPIVNGRRYSFTIQVRKTSLRIIADGRELIAWKTDYANLSPHDGWLLPDSGCLGLGVFRAPTTFHVAELIEVTGKGKKVH